MAGGVSVEPAGARRSTMESHVLAEVIGDWVVNDALRQLQTWGRRGTKNIPISINVGARQLQHPDFVSNLIDQQKRWQKGRAGLF